MLDAAVFLNAFTALFVIIDPIGAALIFHSLNPPHEFKYRIIVALKVFCFSLLLLIGFGVYGKELLAQLGISIAALRIAGGILLFYTAFHMITRELRFDLDSGRGDISVFPMSIPLVAGPGSLTVCILLFSSSSPADTIKRCIGGNRRVCIMFCVDAGLAIGETIGRAIRGRDSSALPGSIVSRISDSVYYGWCFGFWFAGITCLLRLS
jgi:multiple antibiotic resistance protein